MLLSSASAFEVKVLISERTCSGVVAKARRRLERRMTLKESFMRRTFDDADEVKALDYAGFYIPRLLHYLMTKDSEIRFSDMVPPTVETKLHIGRAPNRRFMTANPLDNTV